MFSGITGGISDMHVNKMILNRYIMWHDICFPTGCFGRELYSRMGCRQSCFSNLSDSTETAGCSGIKHGSLHESISGAATHDASGAVCL